MLIKICGITSEAEVEFLNKLDVDYIGLVFTESKRRISIEDGRKILNKLSKKIKPVAVFRNNSLEEIKDVINKLSINIIQLHGREEVFLIDKLKGLNLTLWKGACIGEINEGLNLDCFDKVIYDGANPGSGQELDLSLINKDKPFILSGGLTSLNVKEKLSLKNLIGVDISSGVESINKSGDRLKDYEKCREFVERVREYEKDKGKV